MKKVTLLLALFAFCSWQMVMAQKTITGTVTDANDGNSLPGVNVVVKGTTTGTVTDLKGVYSLKVPANAQSLTFSFIGYQSQDVLIGGQTTINVSLVPSAKELEELVITALGISREKRALGYAVAQVNAKELTNTGSTNFGSALYGKAAGVRVTQAPGGATSAVNINIRGINSLTGTSVPIVVVDGIPIRVGESNNDGYWGDQRIRGNGLIDINPEDIENLTILKGASASALYGSEGANGVVVITTKSGKGLKKGLGVEANLTYTIEQPSSLPVFQNTYGPGYDRGTNTISFGSDDEGWLNVTVGDKQMVRPIYRAYAQFGPKFDGREVIGWDGNVHPYVANEDNYKNLFQTGSNGIYNIAVTNATEKSNVRVSYTRSDYTPIQRGSNHHKNSFSVNGSLKANSKNTTDVVVNYINQFTHNRPEQINRITNNYGGFFSRFDDMDWYLNKYKTSKGYKYVDGTNPSFTPDENIKYRIRAYDLMDFLWRSLEDNYDETSNRIIGSLTHTIELAKGLKLRGRAGTDFTSILEESRNPNTVPLSLGNSGSYSQGNQTYTSLYGDALLMFDKKITNDFGILANLGVSARDDAGYYQGSGTSTGLSVENWYHNSASVGTVWGNSSRWEEASSAIFGTVGFNFRSYLNIEVTGRQERFSKLPPKHNSTFYPSVNAGFIFSEAFKMPAVMDYGKFRISYGAVGVPPSRYKSSIAYNQSALNGIIYNNLPSAYGNEQIKPEEKREIEFGLETKFFKNRLGVDLTYYDGKIIDQILEAPVPISTGFTSMLANVGTMRNYGFEFYGYGKPVVTKDFGWDVRLNFALNRNKVVALNDGQEVLTHASYDADAVRLVSRVGEAMGDFVTYIPYVDEATGKPVIDDYGYYKVDFSEMKTVGNFTPKVTGGLGNTVTYKDFFVDFLIDYRFGGSMLSLGNHYMTGAGMFENTMDYRDEEHGGIAYYVDGDGKYIKATGSTGPNGEKVYHDGVILDGVKADGTANDVIIDAANYYLVTYTWGLNGSWAPNTRYDKSIYENSYIKFREMAIGYNLPKSVVSKIGVQGLTVSLIGRNLFYIYKTFPNADPEVAIGSRWYTQAVDAGSSAATRSLGFSIRASF